MQIIQIPAAPRLSYEEYRLDRLIKKRAAILEHMNAPRFGSYAACGYKVFENLQWQLDRTDAEIRAGAAHAQKNYE